jgi:hypothetical protein
MKPLPRPAEQSLSTAKVLAPSKRAWAGSTKTTLFRRICGPNA